MSAIIEFLARLFVVAAYVTGAVLFFCVGVVVVLCRGAQVTHDPLMDYCEFHCPNHRQCAFNGPAQCPDTEHKREYLRGVNA